MAPSRGPTKAQLEQEARRLRARIAGLEAAGAGQSPGERPESGETASQTLLERTLDEQAEALRLSEQSLRRAFDTAATGLALVDGTGRWVRVNPALCDLTGYSEAELLAADFQSLTHPDDLAADLEGLRKLVAGEITIHRIEKRYLHKSGRPVWILLNVATLQTDAAGRATQFVCQITDITARRAAEEALRGERNFVSAVLDTMGALVVVLDVEGRIVRFNRACETTTGYSFEESKGRPFWDWLVADDERDEVRTSFRRLVDSSARSQDENDWVARDLGRHRIAWSNTCLLDATGVVEFVVATGVDVTEQRRVEEALRRESDLVARLAATSPVGIAVVDRDGRFTFVNKEAARILDLPEDATARSAYDAPQWQITDYDGRPFPEEQSAFRQVLALKRAVHDVRHAMQRPGGRRILLSVNAAPLLERNGEVERVVFVVQDITESMRAERALLESEERFRSIVQSSPMGIHLYTLEADGRLVFRGANPAADVILGLDHAPLVGRTLEEAFPALAGTEVPRRYRLACATGEPWQTEQIDYADGQVRGAFEVHAFRTAPGAMAALFLDITRRKQNEEALRRERDFSDTLVQASPAFFVAITSDGRVAMMNQAMLSALGYSRAEAVGRDYLSTFVPETDRPALGEVFARLIRDRVSTINENRTLTRDGRELLVEWHGRPVLKQDGGFDYFFGVGIDITERRRAAAEKARLETQLTQAKKLEAIGRLAGGVAHDFNNMLAAIQGYAELSLRSLRAGDPLHEPVEQILKASQRAAGLTQQLLAFSRKQVIAPRVIDLNELVVDSTRMLARLIGEDIVLDVLPGVAGGRVKADPHQLEQVLVNLAVNARDAMPGGGTLTIGTAELEIDEAQAMAWSLEPGRYVELSVADTGAGMDEETKSLIFEPFFTTKEKGRGTGLGLATVHGIVRQNRGHVEVSSELGRGTTFRVCLPRVEAPVEQAGEPRKTSAATGTETILLAEDEEIVRMLARTVLTNLGYRVLETDRGRDACRLCEEHPGPIHLLLTDVIMPGMNGRELYQRAREQRPDLRVLYMSGYTEDVIAPHGVLEKGTAFIEKPFSVEGLARKVREVLDR
jgi:two-component system, cell cycle sensor histidine kinase and response regulator CckA